MKKKSLVKNSEKCLYCKNGAVKVKKNARALGKEKKATEACFICEGTGRRPE